MPFQRVRRALLVAASSAVLLAACGGSSEVVSQLNPTRVIAFGDALSDLGQSETGRRYTVNDGGAVNWTQQLAGRYGRTLTARSAGGLSYAVGNARVSATPDAAGNAATPTVAQQIANFLAEGRFGANDLVLINGGISDLIVQAQAVRAGTQTGEQAKAAAGQAGRELAAQVRRIVAAGAQYVVLAGVYNLERSPWAASIGQTALLKDLSAEFNNQLLVSLVNEGRNVLYVDAALHFNLVTGSPGSYSFNDALNVACNSVDAGPGIGIGTGQVNSALCTGATLVRDPNVTVFADPVYFTTRAQVTFGDYAYERARQRF
jgi:outer membrane lipase/esterase